MRYEFRDGRLHLHRTAEEKEPLLQRLGRIEGQVRGVRQMVQDDRYCLDEVQQTSAITAAMREVALLIISDPVLEVMKRVAVCGLGERRDGA